MGHRQNVSSQNCISDCQDPILENIRLGLEDLMAEADSEECLELKSEMQGINERLQTIQYYGPVIRH